MPAAAAGPPSSTATTSARADEAGNFSFLRVALEIGRSSIPSANPSARGAAEDFPAGGVDAHPPAIRAMPTIAAARASRRARLPCAIEFWRGRSIRRLSQKTNSDAVGSNTTAPEADSGKKDDPPRER
jgi:hypothetical protein